MMLLHREKSSGDPLWLIRLFRVGLMLGVFLLTLGFFKFSPIHPSACHCLAPRALSEANDPNDSMVTVTFGDSHYTLAPRTKIDPNSVYSTEFNIPVSIKLRSEAEIAEELRNKYLELKREFDGIQQKELEQEFQRLVESLKGERRCNPEVWQSYKQPYAFFAMAAVPYYMESIPKDNARRIYVLDKDGSAGVFYQYDQILGELQFSSRTWNSSLFYFPHEQMSDTFKQWDNFVYNLIQEEHGNREKIYQRVRKEFKLRLGNLTFKEQTEKIYQRLVQMNLLEESHIRFIYDGFEEKEALLFYLMCVVEEFGVGSKVDLFMGNRRHSHDYVQLDVIPQFQPVTQAIDLVTHTKIAQLPMGDDRFGLVLGYSWYPERVIYQLRETGIHDDAKIFRQPVLFDSVKGQLKPAPSAYQLNWHFWTLLRINNVIRYLIEIKSDKAGLKEQDLISASL